MIWNQYLPYALSIHIEWDTFWHLNPRKLDAYSKADDMERQRRYHDIWLLGQYVASAMDSTVCNVMPFVKRKKKGKYPEEPIRVLPITEEEKKKKEMDALRNFIGFAGALESEVKNKHK